MRKVLLICLTLWIGILSAQDSLKISTPLLEGLYTPPQNKIEIEGSYLINSTAINADFYSSLYQGKFIDDALKNSVSSHLIANNLFGAEIFAKGTYYNLKKRFNIGLSENIDFGLEFTGDAFKTIFYGNKEFVGKTIDLSHTEVKFMHSQSLSFGFTRDLHLTKDSIFAGSRTIDYGISLVKGQNLYELIMPKGSIFTEKNGEYLDITIKGNMYQSDENNNSLGAFNGLGAGLNFKYTELNEEEFGHRLIFEIKNLGLIRWNNNTNVDKMDTTLRFEGIAIDNIFAIQDSTFNNVNVESVAGEGLKSSKAAHFILLPFSVRVNYRKYLSSKNYLEGEITYKYWGTYIPKLIVSYGRKLTKDITAEINGGYGGYGTFHLGANIFIETFNRFQMRIGASDLGGFVLPKQFGNQGLFFIASYSF